MKVSGKGRISIFLYVMDALRSDFLSCYGFDKNTSPNIDALAEEGVLYENAYATTTWTKASAASIVTSQYPRSLRMMHEMDVMPDYKNTLQQVLKKKGFQCYAISANLFFSPSFGFSGFDKFFSLQEDEKLFKKRREDPVESKILAKLELDKAVIALSEDINERIFSILDGNPGSNRLIIAWSVDTHGPYFVRGNKSFFGNFIDDFVLERDVGKKNLEKVKSLYCDMIHYNDYHLGALVSKLKERDLYDDNLIIVTADHGHSFGDHNLIQGRPIIGHTGIVYEEVIKVPLIVKYPQNRFAGKRYKAPVQLTDIYPTILDICGISTEGIAMEGRSLNPSTTASNDGRVIFAESQIRPTSIYSAALRIGDKKFIKVDPNVEFSLHWRKLPMYILYKLQIPLIQLYDLHSDPNERGNLARKNKNQVEQFLEEYYKILKGCNRKAEEIEKKEEKSVDEEIKKRLRALGYFNE